MRNIKLTIEYDGTNYHGWQRQPNAVAVQDVIERAIETLTGEKCTLIGSGRTDAGVHAIGQVANFFTNSSIPPPRFSPALNSILPDDIVIKDSREVGLSFHSQYSSVGKKYAYLIYNFHRPSALLRNRAFYVPYELDFESMQKAVLFFEGTHDFNAFKASGRRTCTTVRTITDVSLKHRTCGFGPICEYENESKKARLIEFEISGSGFLYNMVRIIAGTLVEVGMGKMRPQDIPEIICGRDRKKAGKTAPAHGLYLVEVFYDSASDAS